MSGFLDKVYAARTPDETRAVYDDWAKSYEAEVTENGYVTPGRCADALASALVDKSVDILDFGCGTGLSGMAFRLAGFSSVDGVDLSAEMLAQARSKGVYRSLTQIEAGTPLGFAPGTYAAIAAVGVIGAGAAPLSVFSTLLGGLAPGGYLVFSFNDHTLEDPAYQSAVDEAVSRGAATLLFCEHGPHLPKRDMKSTVYLLRKT